MRSCASSWVCCLRQLVILGEVEVGVLRMRPEFAGSGHVEDERGQDICCIAEPDEVVGHGAFEQVHHDAGEVDVHDHHDIEVLEELQLG